MALWPEHSLADAHDALLPPRQICSITGAVWFGKRLEPRGPCGRKITQLTLMMLSSRRRQICSITGAVWFGKRLNPREPCGRKITQLTRQICSITGAVWFGKRLEPRGPCGRKITQLMLMMLWGGVVWQASGA